MKAPWSPMTRLWYGSLTLAALLAGYAFGIEPGWQAPPGIGHLAMGDGSVI